MNVVPQHLSPTADAQHPGMSGSEAEVVLARLARLAAMVAHAPRSLVHLGAAGESGVRAEHPGGGAAGRAAERWLRPLGARAARTGAPVLATEPGAAGQALLGVPLRQGDEAIGVLVVLDRASRRWGAEEVAALEDLARMAAAELDRLRAGSLVARPTRPRPRAVTDDDATGILEAVLAGAASGAGGPEPRVVPRLRELITAALDDGSLRVGDRLPSIRRTAEAFGVTPYSSLQAYTALEAEGLVEMRQRSGIFVAALDRGADPELPETGSWMAEMLTQACEHQLKIPSLPELIQRWTRAVPVRCVCVDDCVDYRAALCEELEQQFGMRSHGVATGHGMPAEHGPELREADLLVTTAYHAAALRPLAQALGKPLLVATLRRGTVAAAVERIRAGALTVVCVDPLFGERVRSLDGGAYRERVRVVLAEDADAVRSLDRAEPVLLTPAARQALKRTALRLIVPPHPMFSLRFARAVAATLVWTNLTAARA